MSLKSRLREKALELGFAAAGFTGVEPLELYIEEYESRPPEMVRGMCAWALGRIGGRQARDVLELRRGGEDGLVREEIDLALAEAG